MTLPAFERNVSAQTLGQNFMKGQLRIAKHLRGTRSAKPVEPARAYPPLMLNDSIHLCKTCVDLRFFASVVQLESYVAVMPYPSMHLKGHHSFPMRDTLWRRRPTTVSSASFKPADTIGATGNFMACSKLSSVHLPDSSSRTGVFKVLETCGATMHRDRVFR